MQVASDSPPVINDRPRPPILRYPGSKHAIAAKIARFIPASADAYAEPYCGTAAVLFAKARHRMETLNDKGEEIWHFLTTFRDHREELIEYIRWTPWSVREHEEALQPSDDPIVRAGRFYFRCWSSYKAFDKNPTFRRQYFISRGRNGNRAKMTTAARLFTRVDHLHWYAERLRGVAIENMNALEFITRYDSKRTVFYVDPPYLAETRSRTGIYEFDDMDEDDHEELAQVLHAIDGMAIVSHYDCDLYQALYEDWLQVDIPSRIDGGGTAVESLWISPHTAEVLRHEQAERERERERQQEAYPLLALADQV